MPNKPALTTGSRATGGERPRAKNQRLKFEGKERRPRRPKPLNIQVAQCDERIADIDRQLAEARQNREELQLKKAAEQNEPRAVLDRLNEWAKANLSKDEFECDGWKQLTGACDQMIAKIGDALAKKIALSQPPAAELPTPPAEIPGAEGMETDEEEQQLEQEFESMTAKHLAEVQREAADSEVLRAMTAKFSEIHKKRRKL